MAGLSRRSLGFGILIIGIASHPSPSYAMRQGEKLKVSMSLRAQAVMVGEPIVLDYAITNVSPRRLTVNWKGENLARSNARDRVLPPWMTVEINNHTGQRVVAIRHRAPPYKPADILTASPVPEILPGKSRNGTVVLSHWYSLPKSGAYAAKVRVSLPFEDHGVHQTHDTEHDILINLTEPSIIRLRNIAASLKRQITESTDQSEQETLIDALFSMPETRPLASWRDLTNDSSLGLNAFVLVSNHLGRIGSPNAVRILYEAALDRTCSPERRELCKQALIRARVNNTTTVVRAVNALLNDLD